MTEGGVTHVPREARPFQGRTAGLVSRLIANTVDAAVVVVALAVGYLSLNAVLFLLHPRGFSFTTATPFLSLTLASVLSVLYLAASWATTGRSYGDHVMGLRVVSGRGMMLRPFWAFTRAVLYVVLPVGLLWCAVSASNRSVQDIVLRTKVVYDWQPGPLGTARRGRA
ncbi:MAG: RDD family protein [Nocardioidaceae bacterium]